MVGDNPYLEGALAPVPDEVLALDLPVTGTLPEELEGRWLRNGPNPLGPTDPATHHWFLGDGMVHGVRLCGGRAEWCRNRWVRGPSCGARRGRDQEPTRVSALSICYGLTKLSSLYCACVIGLRSPSKSLMM